jgi:NAD(P)H-dependent FMN reductase
MPKLLIILASTRPGRSGEAVGDWFIPLAREHGGFDIEVADLAEIDLPLFDEPNHPRLREYTHRHTKRWSETVDAADAFVFIHPEYNHGPNAALKNAIDYLHHEWAHKPVGFVSYDGISAGVRAVAQLISIVSVLRMTPIAAQVNIPFFRQFIDADDRLQPNEVMAGAAKAMLDEIADTERALRTLRCQAVA